MVKRKNEIVILTVTLLLCTVVTLAGCTYEKEEKKDEETEVSLLPEGTPPEHTIALEGLVDGSSVSISEIAGMKDILEQVNVTKDEETIHYVGMDLYELLLEKDVRWGAGSVKVEAADGYSYIFDFFDLYYGPAKLDQEKVMVAIVKDGEWLDEDIGVKIVAPDYDKRASVRNITRITVEPRMLTVNGSMNQTLEIDVTDFEDRAKYTLHTFTATVPDKGSDEYTGVAISDILINVGNSNNTTDAKVRVHAHDGYFVDFTYSDMLNNPESENPIILTYRINGEYLSLDKGALMLVAPDDNFSGDDTNWFMMVWCKCVVRLEVI